MNKSAGKRQVDGIGEVQPPDRYFLWIAAGVGVAFCALAVVLVVTLVVLMGGL